MNRIIAAVRSKEEFNKAVKSNVEVIFHLAPDLHNLGFLTETAHKNSKKIFIHIDLATGIGKDKSGIEFVKNTGVDGVISTRVNMIKIARELGLFTVQRFFIVDSHSIQTTVESVKSSNADMIEIMPGIIPKVIKKLCKLVDVPIIAGGIVDSENEIKEIVESGAFAISTGKEDLWQIN